MDSAVRNVIRVEMVTISRAPLRPTFPTTQPNLRYMMTPRIVRIEGVNTPPKVPRPAPVGTITLSVGGGPVPATVSMGRVLSREAREWREFMARGR